MSKNEQSVASSHKNIYVALAAAQASMGPVVKGSTNPHFRSKYADLSDVMRVAIPALTENGICLCQSIIVSDSRDLMRTTLTHGDSETSVHCDVPLIVQKNDMQGMKSATTYAKRIGLESLAGIAPEDDDGNAAVKAAPQVQTVSAGQFTKLRDLAQAAGVTEQEICAKVGAPSLEQFPADRFGAVAKGLQSKIDAANPSPAEQITEDEIPY